MTLEDEGLLRLSELWAGQSDSGGTATRVHETLRRGILEQVLQPGMRLTEEKLAEILGVSRTPIRDAITRLEAEGMVERSSVRTVTVSRLSPEAVAEVYEVREWLDGVVAYLAAQRMTPPGIAEARWINERLKSAAEAQDCTASESITAMESINLEFHDCLALAANNTFLLSVMRQARDRVRPLVGSTFSNPERAEQVTAEHDEIIDLIEAGDAEGSAMAARTHMRAAARIRASMLEAAADD